MKSYEDDLFGDAASQAFKKLKAGEVDDDFRAIAHELAQTNQEPTLTEGTLLMIAGDLYRIRQFVEGKITEEHLVPAAGHRNALIHLAFVQGEIIRNGLRSIGRQILNHCAELSVDEEVTAMLKGLQDFDHNAPSAN